MSKIFISYRRQDSRPVATLIYDPLARHFEAKFGAGAVFMDVHGIPLGVNFRSYLNEQVANAELLLALIADRWLIAVDEHGARRLDSPNDFVRVEIEAALKRGIPVVPVYVDDAKFLREADLPDGLKDLAWYNGYNLSTDGSKFPASIASLIAKLEPHLLQSPLVADDKTRVEEYLESGEKHYNEGDYDSAIADYHEAIRLDPEDADSYNNRGNAYYDTGDYDHAITDYDQAIRIDTEYADAYYNRGNAYYRKGEYDRAIADYDQAIRIDPEYAGAYNSRGLVYDAKGNYDRAIADFDQAIRLNPRDALAYNNRGAVYGSKGDYERAIADCEQAIRIDPKDGAAYYNRGNAYRNKDDHDRAIADYDRALAINPNHQLAAENKRIAEAKRARQNKKKRWFY